MYVNTWPDHLNVRNTPNIDGDIINTLYPETDVLIIDEDYDPSENTIFFMILCLVKDEYGRRWLYGNYGTEAMTGGTWKMVDYKTIELEARTTEGEVYSTHYLSNINFIDNDMITCFLFGRFVIMKNLDRDWDWNGN